MVYELACGVLCELCGQSVTLLFHSQVCYTLIMSLTGEQIKGLELISGVQFAFETLNTKSKELLLPACETSHH